MTIDPKSPVPLYYQIAQAIRAQIEAGSIAPGDVLEPLRKAADTWGVNLHTVRHAYAALAREGLIERSRGARGTRVLARPTTRSVQPGLDDFLAQVVQKADVLFGLSPSELATAIATHLETEPSQPVVYVVECSEWQCASHARELMAAWNVEARIWPLSQDEAPPDGVVVSTYFHYNDIRCQWPHRLEAVRFITIRPDSSLKSTFYSKDERVLVCERDEATARAVTADLVALFGETPIRFEPVVEEPAVLLAQDEDVPVLFPPRVWADMAEPLRMHPRAIELRYVFEPTELEALGETMLWNPQTHSQEV